MITLINFSRAYPTYILSLMFGLIRHKCLNISKINNIEEAY
jgi:hypothetical protein